MPTNDELVGMENALGKEVMRDPRVVSAYKAVEKAIQDYEAIIILVSIEQGLVTKK